MDWFNHSRSIRFAVLMCCLFAFTQVGKCQLSRPGQPIPLTYPGTGRLKVYTLEVSEREKQRALVPDNALLKPAGSGMMVEVDYPIGTAGQWDTLADGMRIWRAGFTIPGTRLMSLNLSPFHVSRGVRVFLYDRNQQHVLGAFSDLNNHPGNLLATGSVPGDMVILEVQVPAWVSDPGSLRVSGVGCDFSGDDLLKRTADEWFGASGACNSDIACGSLPAYQKVKNAVVRIVYLGDERCTGTLINNALNDGKNYVLTAGHCIQSESVANAALFYFGYESPWCGGPDGPSGLSVSGATLRAHGDNLDFALLELIEPPSFMYHPYYAGWDRSVVPPSAAYTIHHPLGDVKKISLAEDPLTIATFSGLFAAETHWKVSRWAVGTTEAGSSGAGLFDSGNRLRGSLTGGEASCSNSVNDYFQMFSHDWSDNGDPEKQLAHWLDPKNSGLMAAVSYDPYAWLWESGDTLSNLEKGEGLGEVGTGLTWGSWSGHNSAGVTALAERFTISGEKKMLGLMMTVAHNRVASESAHLKISILKDQGLPGAVIYDQPVWLSDLAAGHSLFIAFDSAVSVADSFFTAIELFYETPQDTFALAMATDRDVAQQGTAWVYNGAWSTLADASAQQVTSSFALMPVVYNDLPPDNPPPAFPEKVRIYPNPARDGCQIEFSELSSESVDISIYDLQGNLVQATAYGKYRQSLWMDTSTFEPGVYVVVVNQGSTVYRIKLVLIR
jgi:lysyl endopeptidase